MGAVNTTYTFSSTDTITSAKMNNIIDETTLTADAITGTTLEVAIGKLKVRSGGITSNEMGTNAVTTTNIVNGAVTAVKLVNANYGDFTITGGVATLNDGLITTTKIVDSTSTTTGVTGPKIANESITAAKLNGAQTGTAPIYGVRAWAKLNPYVLSIRTGAYKFGSYVRTATSTSLVISGHGLKAEDKIRLDFTSGTGTDGLYKVISSANVNEFVVDHVGAATSGTVQAQFVKIQESGNISTASWYDAADNRIVLNFKTPMSSNGYATIVTGQLYPGSWYASGHEDSIGDTQLNTEYQAHIALSQNGVRFASVSFVG